MTQILQTLQTSQAVFPSVLTIQIWDCPLKYTRPESAQVTLVYSFGMCFVSITALLRTSVSSSLLLFPSVNMFLLNSSSICSVARRSLQLLSLVTDGILIRTTKDILIRAVASSIVKLNLFLTCEKIGSAHYLPGLRESEYFASTASFQDRLGTWRFPARYLLHHAAIHHWKQILQPSDALGSFYIDSRWSLLVLGVVAGGAVGQRVHFQFVRELCWDVEQRASGGYCILLLADTLFSKTRSSKKLHLTRASPAFEKSSHI